MTATRRSGVLMIVLLAVGTLGCNRPFFLLPGGAIDGATTPVPEDWSFTDAIDTVQLETNPREPYSVNIWVIALEGSLYVHAGANRAAWVEHMEDDPNVRMRVEERVYELSAVRTTDQAEFDRFSEAYERKYGRRPRNENASEAYLFRLTSRS